MSRLNWQLVYVLCLSFIATSFQNCAEGFKTANSEVNDSSLNIFGVNPAPNPSPLPAPGPSPAPAPLPIPAPYILKNTWRTMSQVNAPSPRSHHVAAWTGSRMLVFGGMRGDSLFGDGGSYDPVTNMWTPLSRVNAPSGRFGMTGVWTGSRYIIFGGCSSRALNDGYSYDPSTDTWTTISAVNAPSPRCLHQAVWTGNRMVVFAGDGRSGGGTELNDGGIYDPATNTWTPLPMAGAPSVRWIFLSLWTGAKMLVIGGTRRGATEFPSDNGMLDLAAGTWASISSTGAPSPRYYAAGVWTGFKAVVFGGFDGSTQVDTGGIFDPLANAWSPLSVLNAPRGRGAASMVFTGTKALLFGGYGPTGVGLGNPTDHKIFDPIANTWSDISTLNAPLSRRWHTAVWTGTSMLVFGGSRDTAAGYVYENSGGILE